MAMFGTFSKPIFILFWDMRFWEKNLKFKLRRLYLEM